METMKDYHDLYLKCDVLVLADVFEKFRNNSLKNYGLCPSHYLSALAFSWDAMLNMTKVKLEIFTDPEMYISYEKVREVEFLIFLIHKVKPTRSIWNLMTQNKNRNILYT